MGKTLWWKVISGLFKWTFGIVLNFLCVWVFISMYVCTPHACLQRSELELTYEACEQPCGSWEWNQNSLQKQQVILSAEPSPYFYWKIFDFTLSMTQSWAVTETIWPRKLKMFIIWPLTEKVAYTNTPASVINLNKRKLKLKRWIFMLIYILRKYYYKKTIIYLNCIKSLKI